MTDFNKGPKVWRTRVIATEEDGVKIATSHPPCKVIEGLYFSNLLTASFYLKGIATAYYNNVPQITHVLSLISGKPWQLTITEKASEPHIVHKTIIIQDTTDANLLEHFPGKDDLKVPFSRHITNNTPEICSFIHSALSISNAKVLVHCFAGISRSASAIAAYLIWAYHMSFDRAITLLRINRPQVNPDTGFCKQLVAWQHMDCELLGENHAPKGWYVFTCKDLGLKRSDVDLLASRRFARPELGVQKGDEACA